MNKKRYLLLGFITTIILFIPFAKAEKEVVYSLEGNITYEKGDWRDFNGTKEEWEILYNISIPIKLQTGDILYWHSQYSQECDVLTIIFYLTPTHWTTFYPHPDYHDICNNRYYHNIGNIGTDYGENTFVLVKRGITLNPEGYGYHLTWKLWIERDIDIVEPGETIGIGLIPFLLGFMCIGVIMIYRRSRK